MNKRSLACVSVMGLVAACGLACAQVKDASAAAVVTDVAVTKSEPVEISTAKASALDRLADQMAVKTIAYFRATQHSRGGWSVPDKPGVPNLPAITALALNGIVMQPGIDMNDAMILKATDYILSFQKEDGGIYDTILPSYNTAISVSALSKLPKTERVSQALARAVEFMRGTQWGTSTPMGVGGAGGKESPTSVGADHPFYGGVGYGNRGRPDISNTGFFLQALHDAGVPSDDPAFARALIFLARCQMIEKDSAGKVINDQKYAVGSKQGGFIYATAENSETVGLGQSFAGEIIETMSDGGEVSKLRAYGSVSYIGFKSYIYAGLSKNDPRVVAVVNWLANHYGVLENPGIGTDGYYYFALMFARAMDASGIEEFDVVGYEPLRTSMIVSAIDNIDPQAVRSAIEKRAAQMTWPADKDGKPAEPVKISAVRALSGSSVLVHMASDQDALRVWMASKDLRVNGKAVAVTNQRPSGGLWRADLIGALRRLQGEDGSFASIDDRWMENNPSLTSAYALLAIQHARKDR